MLEKEDNAYVISNLVMTLVELSELKYLNLNLHYINFIEGKTYW